MKVSYSSLIFEVTRRCNMSCAHCLRGDAMAQDIPFEVIDRALEGAECISSLSFTGGEPTLNLPAMQHVLDTCKKNGIQVYGYFIATNGKVVTDEFIKFMMDLHCYVLECGGGEDEEYDCSLALSKDEFHDSIPVENEYRLRALSAYTDIKQGKFSNWKKRMLIRRGRAKDLEGGWEMAEPIRSKKACVSESCGIIYVDDRVLVSANGKLITDCDYSYDEEEDFSIGDLGEESPEAIFSSCLGEDAMDMAS